MSYTMRNGHVEPMGDALSDLLKCGQGVVGAVIGGVADPYLPEVLCRVSQLQALRKKPAGAVPVCAEVPPGRGGIGLERAIKPLRAVVYTKQHPTVTWLGLTALLVVPMLVGYMIGRKTR